MNGHGRQHHHHHRRPRHPRRRSGGCCWRTTLASTAKRTLVHSTQGCLRWTKKDGNGKELKADDGAPVLSNTGRGLFRPPPECRLLEVAHLFLTLRSREKWSQMASLCHKDFYFVDLERVDGGCDRGHDAGHDGEEEPVVDIEAFIGRGRFCSGGLPRVLRNLVSIRAFPSPEDQPAPYYGVVACEFRGENFVYGERLEIWSAAVNYDHLEEIPLLVKAVFCDGFTSLPRLSAVEVPRVPAGSVFNPLIVLGFAIKFAKADSVADFSYHYDNLAAQVEAHGVKGKCAAMQFKEKYLLQRRTTRSSSSSNGSSNENCGLGSGLGSSWGRRSCLYRFLDDAFKVVDADSGCVRVGFECLIAGSQGKGTQFLYFDKDGKVAEVVFLRHRAEQRRWVEQQLQMHPTENEGEKMNCIIKLFQRLLRL